MSTALLTPELIAGLQGLELRARTIVDTLLAGQHRSLRKGFSAQFAEHRAYSPGDDLRYIDWKLFGKRDRYYVRQFEDETRLRAWLIIDSSPSMHYRSKNAPLSKLGYAAVLAATIGWLVLSQRDELGATLAGREFKTLGAQGHPSQWKQLIAFIEAELSQVADRFVLAQQAFEVPSSHRQKGTDNVGRTHMGDLNKSTVDNQLHRLAEQIPARSLIVWLTDAFFDPGVYRSLVQHCHHRQQDLRVLHVVDAAEDEFLFDEPTLFRGLEEPVEQQVHPRAIRQAYLREWRQFIDETEREVRRQGGDYLFVRTDQPFDAVLGRWLSERW